MLRNWNHSRNPDMLRFVGREREVAEIIAFCERAPLSSSLRSLALYGEPGIGKTRLVTEALAQLTRKEVIVIRVRLYANASRSLEDSITLAVNEVVFVSGLNPDLRCESLNDCLAQLRWLASLRSTVILFENINNMGAEQLRDFAMLIDGLSDDPINVIVTSRNPSPEARGLLLHTFASEITLGGLSIANVRELWKSTTHLAATDSLITQLHSITKGIPVALRAALQEAFASGLVVRDGGIVSTDIESSEEILVSAFRCGVQTLIEGSFCILDTKELAIAHRLACLGAQFTKTTAMLLDGCSEPLLERLCEKKLLLKQQSSLRGFTHDEPDSTAPVEATSEYSFSSTLAHEFLVAHAQVDANELLRLLAAGADLQTCLPVELIAERFGDLHGDDELLTRAGSHLSRLALRAYEGATWPKVECLRGLACSIKAHVGSYLNDSDTASHIENIDRMLIATAVHLHGLPEFDQLLESIAAPSSRPHPELSAIAGSMRELLRHCDGAGLDAALQLFEHIEGLPGRWFHHPIAIQWLRIICDGLFDANRLEQLEDLVRRACVLPQMCEATEPWPHSVDQVLEPYLWLLPQGESDILASTVALLQRPLTPGLPFATFAAPIIARFCIETAKEEKAIEVLDHAISSAGELDHHRSIQRLKAMRWALMLSRGKHTDDAIVETIEQMRALHQDDPTSALIWASECRSAMMLTGAINDRSYAVAALASFCTQLCNRIGKSSKEAPDSNNPILLRRDVLRVIESLQQIDPFNATDTLTEELAERIARALTWLHDQGLDDDHEQLKRILAEHAPPKRVKAIIRQSTLSAASSRPPRRRSPKVRLCVIGTLSAEVIDGEVIRINGQRTAKVLSLLVAQAMQKTPLPYNEFCRIAAETMDDNERARNVVYIALHRLRKDLGEQTIVNVNGVPQLDLTLVDIDLYTVVQALNAAEAALKQGAILLAVRSLNEAIDLWDGGIVFAGQFDEIFESARDEFEFTLSSVILKVAQVLLEHQDVVQATLLLERVFPLLKDDLAIEELYRDALFKGGRYVSLTVSPDAGSDDKE